MRETRHKGSTVACFVALLLTAAPSESQNPHASTDVQQVALTLLREQLRSNHLSTSSNFISRIAEDTGSSVPQVIASTSSLLDTLDQHRRTEGPTWRHLTVASSGEVSSTQASLFLSHLIATAKKTIRKEGHYPLKRLIESSAQTAGIPPFQAIPTLTQALDYALGDIILPPLDISALPPRISVHLKLHSTIAQPEIGDTERRFFTIPTDHPNDQTVEDFFIRLKILNLHNELLTILAQTLKRSERFSEVHEQSYGKIPQYTLTVELTQFELKRVASKGTAFYAPSVKGTLILSPGSFDYEILNEPFTILGLRSVRNIEINDGATTDFSLFFIDIAGEIRKIFEKSLAKLR
jgi:hypothetical protein